MIHADQVLLPAVGEQIETHMLHGVSQMCRRGRRRHGIERLRRQHTSTSSTTGNKLLDVINHPGPVIKTTGKSDGFVDTRMTRMEETKNGFDGGDRKYDAATVQKH